MGESVEKAVRKRWGWVCLVLSFYLWPGLYIFPITNLPYKWWLAIGSYALSGLFFAASSYLLGKDVVSGLMTKVRAALWRKKPSDNEPTDG